MDWFNYRSPQKFISVLMKYEILEWMTLKAWMTNQEIVNNKIILYIKK